MPRFILFCLLLLFSQTIKAGLPETQRGTLQTVYDDCGGALWYYNENWNNGGDPCASDSVWEGVTCNASGDTVIRLEISSEYDGRLDCVFPDLSALVDITVLDLRDNQLTGEIPNFTSLPELQYLDLRNNQLTGEIPDFSFQSLQTLHLGENQLTGEIPNFDLSSLQTLHLGENQLTGEIPNFTSLPELQYLYLQDNLLSGEIPNFTHLQKLRLLYLQDNLLSGEIPNFTHLQKLQLLHLNGNLLSGEVPNFTYLSSLERLILDDNHLCGTLPELFSGQVPFPSVSLTDNTFTTPAPTFCETGSCRADFDDAAGYCCPEGSYPDSVTVETCNPCRAGCAICHDNIDCDIESSVVCHDSCETCDDEVSCLSCPDNGSILWDDDTCRTIITKPDAALTWTLYYNGCIGWDNTAFGPEEEGTFTLHSGDDQMTFASGVPLIDGQYNWIIYGVVPSTSATIEAVFGTRDSVFSPEFTLLRTAEGIDNPCLSI